MEIGRVSVALANMIWFGLAGVALAQSVDDVAAACGAASNLSPGMCDCVGAMAADELTETQRQWYIHAMRGNDEAAQALLPEMSFEEVAEAATFVRTAPTDCARGQ